MTKAYIYSLNDPITKEPVYVGQTIKPKARFSQHLSEATMHPCYGNRKKGDWILNLRAKGLVPEMKLLEEVDLKNANDTEFSWIEKLRAEGRILINSEYKRPCGIKKAIKRKRLPIEKA